MRLTRKAILETATALVAVSLTLVIYWKALAKLTLPSWCSYLSLALPMLGFVATRNQPGVPRTRIGATSALVAAPPQESVDDLVKEIAAEWRQQPIPPPPPSPAPALSAGRFLLSVVANPRTAFLEIKGRMHLEVVLFPLLLSVFFPLRFRDPTVSFPTNYLIMFVGLPFYELGKAGMMMIAARLLKMPLSFRAALFGVMITDISPAVLFLLLVPLPGLIGRAGREFFFRPGLGDFVAALGTTNPLLFNLLAQFNFFALWSYFLWWIGLAALLGLNFWRVSAVAFLKYTVVHFMLCPALQVGKIFVVW